MWRVAMQRAAFVFISAVISVNAAEGTDGTAKRYEFVHLVFSGCLARAERIVAAAEALGDWSVRLLPLQMSNQMAPAVAGMLVASSDSEPTLAIRKLMGDVVGACMAERRIVVQREHSNFGDLLEGAVRELETAGDTPPIVVIGKREATVYSPTFVK